MAYPIINVTENYQIEQLGTKSKFWFRNNQDAEINPVKYLCKIGRSGTGENWAEKVTSELAQLLEIPCVNYDLAKAPNGEKSVVCPSFIGEGGSLIHANELLSRVFSEYPEQNAFEQRQYKLSTSFALLKKLQAYVNPPVGFNATLGVDTNSIVEVFISYLMFDCLIGNQDRHDENWGIVAYLNNDTVSYYLAPTYDHASSLACRLSDVERFERLESKDKGYQVSSFVLKARTPFYDSSGINRLKTIESVEQAITISKSEQFAKKCADRIGSLTEADLKSIFDKIPSNFITEAEIIFSIKMIEENIQRISKMGLRNV